MLGRRAFEYGTEADWKDVDPRIPLTLVTGTSAAARRALLERMAASALQAGALAIAVCSHSCWPAETGGEALSTSPRIVRGRLGTIHCLAANDPVQALYHLHLRKLGMLSPLLAYEAITFEIGPDSNTAEFISVVQNDARIDSSYRTASVICAVQTADCKRAATAGDAHLIAVADTVVLTGCGRGGTASRAARSVIASLNPLAAIVELDHWRPETHRPWRLAVGRFNDGAAAWLARNTGMVRLGQPADPVIALTSNLHNDARNNGPQDGPICRALRIRMPGDVDLLAFLQTIMTLCLTPGPEVLRLSAVLNVRHADYPVAVDVIAGTLLAPAYHSREPRTDSDISIIARGLDVRAAVEAFRQCAWSAAVLPVRLQEAI